MWMQLAVGVGGMVVFGLLFGAFHLLAERMRAMSGECRLNSIRCLGCLATGRCRGATDGGPDPSRAPRA